MFVSVVATPSEAVSTAADAFPTAELLRIVVRNIAGTADGKVDE
jgi:hypothetical protein